MDCPNCPIFNGCRGRLGTAETQTAFCGIIPVVAERQQKRTHSSWENTFCQSKMQLKTQWPFRIETLWQWNTVDIECRSSHAHWHKQLFKYSSNHFQVRFDTVYQSCLIQQWIKTVWWTTEVIACHSSVSVFLSLFSYCSPSSYSFFQIQATEGDLRSQTNTISPTNKNNNVLYVITLVVCVFCTEKTSTSKKCCPAEWMKELNEPLWVLEQSLLDSVTLGTVILNGLKRWSIQ